MSMAEQLTVCALLHGNYEPLARRCLQSICAAKTAPDVGPVLRVGVNDVGADTRQLLDDLGSGGWLRAENLFDAGRNIHKYPMMRRMFYGRPITTPYVMWFDDDSYITKHADFFEQVLSVMAATPQPAICGATYTMQLVAGQAEYIRAQPWFTGRPVEPVMRFVTGGWWTARMDFLREHDYPWPALDHNGGDVMLGALCAQQSARIAQLRRGVAINADDTGRESKAPRRGFSGPPLGKDFSPSPAGPRGVAEYLDL